MAAMRALRRLFSGRPTYLPSAFALAWEEEVGLTKVVPFLVEDELMSYRGAPSC
jgi:hypothetical protein